jgi:hypothetical protein
MTAGNKPNALGDIGGFILEAGSSRQCKTLTCNVPLSQSLISTLSFLIFEASSFVEKDKTFLRHWGFKLL